MVRSYNDIIDDYLDWAYIHTGKEFYNKETFYSSENRTIDINKGIIIDEILDLCYKPTEGLYWFVKFVLGNMTYAGYPAPIVFNKLWWRWTKISSSGDHISLVSSRQVGKSTFWTCIIPVYRMTMFKNYNILIESASEDQAVDILSRITTLINSNELLLNKKEKHGKWSSTEITYNDCTARAKGVGSEVRGGTYDLIICDDIIRSDNKLSDQDIENFVDEELEPMVFIRKGQIIIVGTKMSPTDIFSTVEERIHEGGEWQIHYFPAILDWEQKLLLCPDRFTWDQLMRKRAIMGKIKFAKEFLCEAYSSGTQLFAKDVRDVAKKFGTDYKMHRFANMDYGPDWFYYIGVDLARAGTASADYTVVTVLAYNPKTGMKRIAWIWKAKGMKITEQVQKVAEIAQNFKYPVLLVEKNNIGVDFIDMMIDNYNLNVEAFTTTKTSKEDLIRFLINIFENEKFIMPTQDEYSREEMGELDHELDRFVVEITRAGNEVMKGSGKSHDDMVMSLALANKCSQSYGYEPYVEAYDRKSKSGLEMFAQTNDPMEILKL